MSELENIFEEAVHAKGDMYLMKEQRLYENADKTRAILSHKTAHPDPIARLLASVLLSWFDDQQQEYLQALSYLSDYAPSYFAKTPVGSPPPEGVASFLAQHYQNRVARLLTLRLVKSENWPNWQATGVLLYLHQQKSPSTTEGLLRFAVETPNETWRKRALKAVQAIGDPALAIKVQAERERCEQLDLEMPSEVDQLSPRK
jgi:hypothetical protein